MLQLSEKQSQFQDCESPKTCRYCNRKHHQSICDKGNFHETHSSRTDGASSNSNSNTGASSDNGSNTDVTPTSTNTTSVSKNHQMALLQTAHATALASLSGPSDPVRVLFDSGSQLSYVTDRLQQQLDLKHSNNNLAC